MVNIENLKLNFLCIFVCQSEFVHISIFSTCMMRGQAVRCFPVALNGESGQVVEGRKESFTGQVSG